MSVVHKCTFPVEAADLLRQAADEAMTVKGVRGYRITSHADARTLIFQLEVDSKDTFKGLSDSPAGKTLWKQYQPHSHEFSEVQGQSY